MKNRMEILKYVVLGAVIAFTLLFITGQLKMTEKYESGDEIQAEIDKLLEELDEDSDADDSDADDSDDESDDESGDEGDMMIAPSPM